MFSVPAEQGMQARCFCVFELTHEDKEPTLHAYSVFYGRDWRWSTALQKITIVDTDVGSQYSWRTKSGSTYCSPEYREMQFNVETLLQLRDWFRGATIRQLSKEEFLKVCESHATV